VRSRYAHGIINAIDTAEAAAMPGVLGVYTGPDLTAAGIKNMPQGQAIPTRAGTEMHRPSCPALTSDTVRYVGDPVAIVVAETVAGAKDAAEAVFLDIDPLPAATRPSLAAAPGAAQIHDSVAANVAAEFHYGDAAKVATAFATAAHVARLEIPNNRIVVCAMEPRSAIAEYEADSGQWTLRVGCLDAVRAGAAPNAQHPVRPHPPVARRQRRTDRRRRHRRVEIADGERYGDPRSGRKGHRKRAGTSPPTCWRRR
jgi:aerobic carbon-monoxide dehydrogenase large subunit